MLDIKLLREDIDGVIKRLETRGQDFSYLREVITLDEQRREIIQKVEKLKNFSNDKSKEIGVLKREKKDASHILSEVANIKTEIAELDGQLATIEEKISVILKSTPNVPRETITVGLSDEDNKLLRTYGEIPTFDFEPKPHYEVAEKLGILDFERAAKIAGARFVVYKGLGARLERAVINFMLDTHIEEHGYTELLPPFMVNGKSMYGTGQLPKFGDDMFKIEGMDFYLVPTAEVPVTNYHMDEIIDTASLPVKYTAYTPCFRKEAGSAGRDTRGIIRVHQFNKVELVMLAHPSNSYQMLEELTNNAETILKRLELPYRVMELCTGDIGFSSANTLDIEVWMAGFNTYREISSCSNFEDFQARRANIKFRSNLKEKPEFVHTLNGSGLAVGRTVAAILENFQQADGSVRVPKALVPYMGGIEVIK